MAQPAPNWQHARVEAVKRIVAIAATSEDATTPFTPVQQAQVDAAIKEVAEKHGVDAEVLRQEIYRQAGQG